MNYHTTSWPDTKVWYDLTISSSTTRTETLHQRIVNREDVVFEDPDITTEFRLIFYKVEIDDIWTTAGADDGRVYEFPIQP